MGSGSTILRSIHAKSRDNARTPMQWNDGENAGFTSGKPWIKINPNYREINAGRQVEDEDSVFSCYRKLIRFRKEYSVFIDGDFRMLLMDDKNVFAYTREDENSRLLVVCNFFDRMVNCPLEESDASMELLISNYKDADQAMLLRPYEARMYLSRTGIE